MREGFAAGFALELLFLRVDFFVLRQVDFRFERFFAGFALERPVVHGFRCGARGIF